MTPREVVKVILALWRWTLAALVVFGLLFVVSAQIPALRAQSPWGEDPWDAVVSYAVLIAPIVAAPTWLRVMRTRREGNALPPATARLALRGIALIFAIVAITLASDWAGLMVNRSVVAGTIVTSALILATFATIVCVGGGLGPWRRARAGLRPIAGTDYPDTLEDLHNLIWGSHIEGKVGARWIAAENAVRRWRWPIVVVASLLFGLLFSLWASLVEGPWANLLAAALFAILATLAPLLGYALCNPLLHLVDSPPRR